MGCAGGVQQHGDAGAANMVTPAQSGTVGLIAPQPDLAAAPDTDQPAPADAQSGGTATLPLTDAARSQAQRPDEQPSSRGAETSKEQPSGCGESERAGAPVTPGQSSDAPSIQGASSTDQDAPQPPAPASAAPAAPPPAQAQTFLPLAFRKKRSCEEFTPPVDAPPVPTAPLVRENPGLKARSLGASKACRVCKELKPLTQFHADKRAKDGCYTSCKECWNAYNRTRVQARKAQRL